MLKSNLKAIMEELRKFYKVYLPFKERHILGVRGGKRRREAKMPAIQIMAIMILGQLLGKNFCEFYRDRVNELRKKRFKIVSYSWFLRLRERVVFDLLFFLKYKSTTKGDCFFIDSTPIKVCKNQRISRHKTFKGLAARGHHSMGWFFGFKLHLIVNNRGELVKFRVTQGNVSDVQGLEMAENLQGLLVGDMGYISEKWECYLKKRNLKLITKTRKNMKPKLYSPKEAYFLKKRSLIETIFGQLKNYGLQNTGIRSVWGWILNVLSTLVTFVSKPSKPSSYS